MFCMFGSSNKTKQNPQPHKQRLIYYKIFNKYKKKKWWVWHCAGGSTVWFLSANWVKRIADSNMGWTVQVVVALLNIVWIIFFLTPEPFSGKLWHKLWLLSAVVKSHCVVVFEVVASIDPEVCVDLQCSYREEALMRRISIQSFVLSFRRSKSPPIKPTTPKQHRKVRIYLCCRYAVRG